MSSLQRQYTYLILCGILGVCFGCQKADPTNETKADVELPSEPATNGESTTSVSTPEDSEPNAPAKISLEIASWEEVEQKVAAHAGKIVVLDLWSTSCQPCIREFPHLVELHKQHPESVVCMSVSTDYAGIKSKPPEYYRERVTEFLTKQGATFENYLCSVPSDEIFPKLDLGSIPAVMVFGADGKLVNRFDNDEQKYGDEFTYADHVIPLVEKLIEESKPDAQGEE